LDEANPTAKPEGADSLDDFIEALNAPVEPQVVIRQPGRTFWPEPHGCVRGPEEDEESFARRLRANAELLQDGLLTAEHNATTVEARRFAEEALESIETPGEITLRRLLVKQREDDDRRREEDKRNEDAVEARLQRLEDAKGAREPVQAQARKRRSPDAAILDDIRAAFQRVRDPHDRAEHHAVCREAMDLADDNLGLLNDCANKYGATRAMQEFLRGGGETRGLEPVPLCTYATLSAAQRDAKNPDGPTWVGQCADALEAVPDGEQIMADLARWEKAAKQDAGGAGAEQPWADDAPGYAAATEIVDHYDGKEVKPGQVVHLSLDTVRRYVEGATCGVRYMKYGKRRKIHAGDFAKAFKRDWKRFMRVEATRAVVEAVQDFAKVVEPTLPTPNGGPGRHDWKCFECKHSLTSAKRPSLCPYCSKNTMMGYHAQVSRP
jgi:rubrerythrin